MLETPPRHMQPTPPGAASPDPNEIRRRVIACVASDFGLDVATLETPLRGSQRMSFARQIAMYLAHVSYGLNFDAVGRAFGRDRTTVAHACRVIEDSRDDIWFDCRIATLESVCLGSPLGAGR